jgi:hypothetical protein
MIGRIRAILLEPKEEWPRIAAEPSSVGAILIGWVVPLAAIGPLAQLIGMLFFSSGTVTIGTVTMSLGITPAMAIALAVRSYVLTLIGACICAFAFNMLAPSFGGQKDSVKAMKLVAYGATAGYLAGIFSIFPMLALLGLVGFYSFYLCYVGIPELMGVPKEKAVGYLVVTILVIIVVMAVILWITSPVVTMFM